MTDQALARIETPGVLLDLDRLQRNIRAFQGLATAHDLRVRPHIKTHKCLEIGRMQIDQGAVGITAAKTDEALRFIESGTDSVTVAYPLVVESKLDRLIAASRDREVDLRLVVDSQEGVEAISRVAKKHQTRVGIFLKIDVGLHRCGVEPDDPLLLELARAVEEDSCLDFRGILSHAGQVYGAPDGAAAREIARQEHGLMNQVRQQLEDEGIEVAEVSIGSTPSLLAGDRFEGITEIRPGNYVFMDRTPLRLGLIQPDRVALSVLATVVSANADYFIFDAGSKTLSSDQGAHGMAGMEGFGLAYPEDAFQDESAEMVVAKASEEHGFAARNGLDLPIGSRIRIVPNHSCSVANLAEMYTVVEGGEVVDQWDVAARAQVR